MYKEFDKQVDELLSKMTLTEKVGQLSQVMGPLSSADVEKLKKEIRAGKVGSIIMASTWTAGNDQQDPIDVDLYNELQRVAVEESPNRIPMIFGKDVIHGHRTVYPVPLASAASFNPELVEKCYRNIAKEATKESVHWTFSPMLDLCRDPRWGRIIEGPGEDPYVGAKMAEAVVKGFQGDDLKDKNSLVACAKHYIGYGASEGGRDYHRTEISDYSLYNYYLPTFRAAVKAGIGTVMSSFNDINGQPVTSSSKYLTEILRGRLGFEGFVISDWEAVLQLKKQGVAESLSECAELALNAGLDMDMKDRCYVENLEKLIEDGKVSLETLNESVKRVLRIKLAIGLFENPYCEKCEIDRTEHLRDAKELAEESMVLLKNEGVLPLKKTDKIFLAGPFAKERRSLLGSWTLDGRASETTNFLEAMQNNTAVVFGEDDNFDLLPTDTDVIVLALGEDYSRTGENRCVADISLERKQVDLIKKAKATGKKTVGVIFCGRPIAIQEVADNLDAVLYAWHCGSETANAACNILLGGVNPSGKTTVTFPRKPTHIPLYYNVTSSGRASNCYYGEGLRVCYIDGPADPYYPFGYGLSYTSFEYSAPKADNGTLTLEQIKGGATFKLTAEVKNTGELDGKETVQLYIHDKKASVMRPLRELKAYKKVLIKSGETAKIEFELGFDDLGFYLENGDYTVEAGEFDVYIGENCLTENKAAIAIA